MSVFAGAPRFRDRVEAGLKLASVLKDYAAESPIVLALPRGGVPVGFEVAKALGAPLDVWVVRKVGVPWHPELGLGAVAEGGYVHISRDLVAEIGIPKSQLDEVIAAKRAEVEKRVRRFRGGHPPPELRGRTIILVDDGIATGGTVRAALRAIRAAEPKQVVLAVPVASADTLASLADEVDHIVCPLVPSELYAIGLWYEDFSQVDDDEVTRLLDRARREHVAGPSPADANV
jgi:putative phosphoribosyl transferase